MSTTDTASTAASREILVAGRYRLGPVLGRGGVATVYRGLDTVLGREVAVKVFGPSVDPSDPARVRSEMRILASLQHPCLVAVHDAGTDHQRGLVDRTFLVMQLVDGVSLATLVGEGPLAPHVVAAAGRRIAAGLAYVHGRGVVHRDVKPANILLDATGDAYLADFGIAVTIGASSLTGAGQLVGTAPYLSPEQVRGERVTGAADVYALGLVLLEALTGRREYPGNGVESALARLSRPPHVDDALPGRWRALLTSMTAADPALRPDARTVELALAELGPAPAPLDGSATAVLPAPTRVLGAPPLPAAAPAASSVTGQPARRRRRLVPVLTLVVVALAALLVVFLVTRPASAPATPSVAPSKAPATSTGPAAPSSAVPSVAAPPAAVPSAVAPPAAAAPPAKGNGKVKGKG